ncbi:uncharacterized [Tachysurus ichikawai]
MLPFLSQYPITITVQRSKPVIYPHIPQMLPSMSQHQPHPTDRPKTVHSFSSYTAPQYSVVYSQIPHNPTPLMIAPSTPYPHILQFRPHPMPCMPETPPSQQTIQCSNSIVYPYIPQHRCHPIFPCHNSLIAPKQSLYSHMPNTIHILNALSHLPITYKQTHTNTDCSIHHHITPHRSMLQLRCLSPDTPALSSSHLPLP